MSRDDKRFGAARRFERYVIRNSGVVTCNLLEEAAKAIPPVRSRATAVFVDELASGRLATKTGDDCPDAGDLVWIDLNPRDLRDGHCE